MLCKTHACTDAARGQGTADFLVSSSNRDPDIVIRPYVHIGRYVDSSYVEGVTKKPRNSNDEYIIFSSSSASDPRR